MGSSADIRYERKFLISQLRSFELEHLIRLHPSMFNEIFFPRFVNNIYLDSHSLQNYWDNVCGSSNRLKVRIRWYGDMFGEIASPVLELKIKEGFTNRKESFRLQSFTLDNNFTSDKLLELFDQSDLPDRLLERMKLFQPKLLNRYLRKYYLSSDKCFRVTIDCEMEFTKIGGRQTNFMHSYKDYIQTVLELKYGTVNDDTADTVAGCFPFRITRSSKYVSGIERLYKQFS